MWFMEIVVFPGLGVGEGCEEESHVCAVHGAASTFDAVEKILACDKMDHSVCGRILNIVS